MLLQHTSCTLSGGSWDSGLSSSPDDDLGLVDPLWRAAWHGVDATGGSDLPPAVGCDDEGFLDDCLPDDDQSVASEGSEILQLVNQILQGFNSELAAEARQPAPIGDNFVGAFDDEFVADFSDDCADAVEELPPAAASCCGTDASAFSDLSVSDCEEAESGDHVASSSTDGWTPPAHGSVATATAVVALPAVAAAETLGRWSRVDWLRQQLWSQSVRPPRPDKSRRACSFLLRGCCRKEDCEFAHDLAKVTCKFWASGECFKGATCPFLHGYAD